MEDILELTILKTLGEGFFKEAFNLIQQNNNPSAPSDIGTGVITDRQGKTIYDKVYTVVYMNDNRKLLSAMTLIARANSPEENKYVAYMCKYTKKTVKR